LEAELEDISSVKKGVLRLGIPPMVGRQIADLIRRFRQTYPGIELKISELGGLSVEQAVMSGELDLAMTVLPFDSEQPLTFLPLLGHPMCVV
ncbi:LysR substrate-binding domain-containing protein, partial [Klebsiella pneumoniae]